MRSRTPSDLANRCHTCLLMTKLCICSGLVPRDTQTRIVIVRHWKERWRTSNSGRLATLAIPSISLFDYGGKDEAWSPECLAGPNPTLLFPDDNRPVATGVPDPLVVLDATWSQARKMIRRVPGLEALPVMSLSAPRRAPTRLRKPPTQEGMATVEAIARALEQLGEEETGTFLDDVFADFVRANRIARGLQRTSG